MPRKNGLRLRPDKLFASSGLQTLYTPKVPRGLIWCLESIAWEIDKVTSGGNTRCRLYIDRGAGDKHYLDEQLTPAADWLYTRNEKDYLYEDERLALEMDQGQAATAAKMYITGYREEVKE